MHSLYRRELLLHDRKWPTNKTLNYRRCKLILLYLEMYKDSYGMPAHGCGSALKILRDNTSNTEIIIRKESVLRTATFNVCRCACVCVCLYLMITIMVRFALESIKQACVCALALTLPQHLQPYNHSHLIKRCVTTKSM